MDWQAEWTRTQQELSAASRNETWWKSLPEERRSILGRVEYRKQCRLARQRLKLADERCRALIRTRRDAASAPHTAEAADLRAPTAIRASIEGAFASRAGVENEALTVAGTLSPAASPH